MPDVSSKSPFMKQRFLCLLLCGNRTKIFCHQHSNTFWMAQFRCFYGVYFAFKISSVTCMYRTGIHCN